MADGSPFDPAAWYVVVANSYRGNGGGELFTKGAGISHEELGKRLLRSTEEDLRTLIIQYIRGKEEIDPQPFTRWRLVPESWAAPACARDRLLLFGSHGKAE